MPTPETVLYEVQVKANTASFDSAVGAIPARLEAAAKGSKITVTTDAAGLSAAVASAEGKLKGLGSAAATASKDVSKAFKTDEVDAFGKKVKDTQKEVEKLGSDLEKTGSQSSAFGKLKDSLSHGGGEGGGGGIGGSLLGGAIGGGAASAAIEGFKFIAEKAKIADDAADHLSISIAKAGLSGEAATKEFERLSASGAKIADDFALPTTQVQQLQGTIVGFSGITGPALDHLTEISLGASNALGLSAEGVARVIAKGADPEQLGALKKLGIAFDSNATAAERMAVIEKKLGPAIQATKDSTQDAAGNFERIKNKLEETVVTLGSKLFDAIGPALSAISDAITAIMPVISPLIDVLSFLLDIGIKVSFFPLNAAKAFITWLQTLGPVKDAIAAVGKVISDVKNFIGGLIDTVKNAGDSLLSLIGITTKEDAATKKTSEALKLKADAEQAAADATKQHTEAIEGSLSAMEAEQKGLKDGVDEARRRFLLNKQIAADPSRDEATRKQAAQYVQDNINFAKSNQIRLDLQKKNSDDFDRLSGVTKEKQTAERKSQFQKELEELDAQNKQRELSTVAFERKITDTVIQQSIAGLRKTAELTTIEERQIAEKKQSDRIFLALELQRRLANVDAAGNITSLRVDSKSGDEVKDLATLRGKLITLQNEISKEGLNLLKMEPVITDEAAKNIHKSAEDLAKELSDLKIGNIENEKEREFAALKAKQETELSYINTLKSVGATLTKQELDIERELHIKHERELLDLKKKYAEKANEDVGKIVSAGIDAIFTKQKRLSGAEVNEKVAGFDKEETALKASLSRGEISHRDYEQKIASLTQTRADFEKSQADSVAGVATRAYKAMGAAALDAAGASFASAAANLIAADMTLGPIAGPILAALAVGLIKGLQGEVKGLLGFATGGIGMVGEKGPEIIGPTKDFSQFVSQLVTQTVKTTANSLAENGGSGKFGARGSIRQKVEFGPLRSTGRDLEATTLYEQMAKKTEVLIS